MAGERARGHARAAGGGVQGAGVPWGDHHARGRARIHLRSLVALSLVASRPHRQRGVPRGARRLAQVRGPVDAADARRRRRGRAGHAHVCGVRRVRARDIPSCARRCSCAWSPRRRGARGERRDEDDATSGARARLGEGVAAENPGDMQTFLCLVDLFCGHRGRAARPVQRWLTTLIENVAALVAAPRCCRASQNRASRAVPPTRGVFEQTDAFHSTFDLVRRVRDEGDVPRSCWTCSPAPSVCPMSCAAALQLLLSAPAGLVGRELAPASRRSPSGAPPASRTRAGRPGPVDRTRGTLARSSGHTTQNGSHRRDRRHRARPRGDSGFASVDGAFASRVRGPAGRLRKTDAGATVFDAENSRGLNAGRRVQLRAPRRRVRARRRAGRRAEHDIDTRVARVLGAGAAHALIDDDDRRAFVGAAVGVVDALGLRARVSLDVEVGERARHHLAGPDAPAPRLRSVLHGQAASGGCRVPARRDAADGGAQRAALRPGGAAREATPFHKIYGGCSRRCWSWRSTGSRVPAALLALHASSCGGSRNQARDRRNGAAGRRRGAAATRPRRRGGPTSFPNRVSRDASRETLGAPPRSPRPVRLARGGVSEVDVRSVPSGDLRGGRGARGRGVPGPATGSGSRSP